MAGFLFLMDSPDALENCIENGEYSTRLSLPSNEVWGDSAAGTLGDYATMREGDNVYFFSGRKIHGVGVITAPPDSPFGFYQNAADSIVPKGSAEYGEHGMIMCDTDDVAHIYPWTMRFVGDPVFFDTAIDMDDMLSSSPGSFRSLRCIEDRSFIKLDDRENFAFKTLFYRRNEKDLEGPMHLLSSAAGAPYPISSDDVHAFVRRHIKAGTTEFQRESHLETSLLFDLAIEGTSACDVFGYWDYLSHQVHASPFKPVQYMDRMDVFGYRWIAGKRPMVSKFFVAELKKGRASKTDVPQLLRYVDWVTDQYADGDSSLVEAFLVAHEIPDSVIKEAGRWQRYYTRPKEQKKLVWANYLWKGMRLVEYEARGDGSVRYESLDF